MMRHVLVIEDEYLMAQCVADMAMYAGASSVEIACSAEAAIVAAGRHRPAIIISDVDLKQGGRGPDAVAHIRHIYGTVPTIFVTGNPRDEGAMMPAATILTKPVTAQHLATTFRTIISNAVYDADDSTFAGLTAEQ